MDFFPFIVKYIPGTFMKVSKLSIENLFRGIGTILVKVCTVCAYYCQFLHINYT